MSRRKRILFMTGTRADYGKMKGIIAGVDQKDGLEAHIFVTGMHMLPLYGFTAAEVRKDGFSHVHEYLNQLINEPMGAVLANTLAGFSRCCQDLKPDLLVIHGDRVEALACCLVGKTQGIPIAHFEGGEVSGTVDDMMRHAISSMANLHLVANERAASLVTQVCNDPSQIYITGSPETDYLAAENLPTLDAVKDRYGIHLDAPAMVIFHPVTTELEYLPNQARDFVSALIESGLEYVVIYPNNDSGSMVILKEYERLEGLDHVQIFPSIRFEYFRALLKQCTFLIGNSSSGVREAPSLGTPAIDVGTRQQKRGHSSLIIHTEPTKTDILAAIGKARTMRHQPPQQEFGKGECLSQFLKILEQPETFGPTEIRGPGDIDFAAIALSGSS